MHREPALWPSVAYFWVTLKSLMILWGDCYGVPLLSGCFCCSGDVSDSWSTGKGLQRHESLLSSWGSPCAPDSSIWLSLILCLETCCGIQFPRSLLSVASGFCFWSLPHRSVSPTFVSSEPFVWLGINIQAQCSFCLFMTVNGFTLPTSCNCQTLGGWIHISFWCSRGVCWPGVRHQC